MNFVDIMCGSLIIIGIIPFGLAVGSFYQGEILAGFVYGFVSFFCFAAGISNSGSEDGKKS